MLFTNVSRVAAAVVVAVSVPACTPTPAPGGGVATGCAFAPNQTSQDLRMNCTVTGSPANRLINPVTGGSGCAVDSLSLFQQTLTATATFIYGENGDENSGRVRIGAIVNQGSTHGGRLAKSVGFDCASTIEPVATVSTTFGGTHVALVDKSRTPKCVFQSRFSDSQFNQALSVGFTVDPSVATKDATINAITRALDLEAATAVNNILGTGGSMNAEFRRNAGRCDGDWQPFTGT